MKINEILKNIMENYLNKKIKDPFNKESSMFQLINYTSKDAIKNVIDNLHLTTVNLEVKASCGAGGWTRYPWIAVFNPGITTTIQEGIYIVYLFSEDMKRLYLTLIQGCTNLNKRLGRREAINEMKLTREEFRKKYPSDLFKIDNDLKVGNEDYEEGCIYYKEYSIDEFPSEDKIIEDLSNLILIYNEYYSKEINCDTDYNLSGGYEMEKERSDSWSKIQTENINAIARKAVDHSTFQEGTVIPTRYHERFIENLSNELTRSGKIDITIVIDNQKFGASINFPNLNRKDKVIKVLFRKKLKEYLSKELNTSYQYIMKVKDQGNKGKIIRLPDESQEYMDFYKGEEKDTFIVKLIKKDENATTDGEDFNNNDIEDIEETSNETEIIKDFEVGKAVDYIHNFIESQGYTYDKSLIKNLYISIKTKPFVILSGISGTGKSKIVELFAKSLGATSENKRFNLVPVKPDWSDSTDLLGFRNIEGKFTSGIITKVCYDAMMNPELPYFICLDEMNLARVEYYFSDILSLMETRRLNEDNEIITNTLLSEEQIGRDSVSISTYGDVYIPQNLYIIGTVNMDETTFPFSKKVLDRANTIEFNKVDLSYSFEADDSSFGNYNINDEIKIYHNDFLKSEFLKIRDCIEFKDTAQKTINELIKINSILEKYNYHFGYRVRDEITFYMIYAMKDNLMNFEQAFDLCVVQKILPKISGSSSEVLYMLFDIFELFNNYRFSNREYLEEKELKDLKEKVTNPNEGSEKINYKFKLTNEKLIYMIRRFIRDGFTTFWQ